VLHSCGGEDQQYSGRLCTLVPVEVRQGPGDRAGIMLSWIE
jgi:hypothetical protein